MEGLICSLEDGAGATCSAWQGGRGTSVLISSSRCQLFDDRNRGPSGLPYLSLKVTQQLRHHGPQWTLLDSLSTRVGRSGHDV